MKYLFLFCFIALWPRLAAAQSYVNPDTISQSGDIYLQNTDVYYKPFAPPGDSDTRANLCNESDLLLDPNGVGNYWRSYLPVIYDNSVDSFVYLQNWAPHGTALGPNVVWQRLFTAKRKADGTPSNIIVGSNVAKPDTIIHPGLDGYPGDTEIVTPGIGPVIISKNEDVDFRASGRIILKSGFHVKPGAFFHAYTEPKFDSTVFSDEFDDTAKFHNQWYVGKGWYDVNGGAECSADSNIYLDTDYEAHDGHALDIVIRERPHDTCDCEKFNPLLDNDTCKAVDADTIVKFAFTSAMPKSCPYPYASNAGKLGPPVYAHAPYGKYEFRDKIPHMPHHTNNWGGSWDGEYDLNETDNAIMGRVNPNWNHHFIYGPCKGFFVKRLTDTLFVSPGAGWSQHNYATGIIINNCFFPVKLGSFIKDTAVADVSTVASGGFPSSLVNSTDTFSIYYEKYDWNSSDTVTWTVTKSSDSLWRVFSAPYAIVGGVPQYFTKDYQPIQITLTTDTTVFPPIRKTYNCRWDHTLNTVLIVNRDGTPDSLLSTDLHSNTESYRYHIVDLGIAGQLYPEGTVLIDRDTDWTDTAAYQHTPYRYHTFAMEWLPNEVRILIDSNVVRRLPDRLIPRNSPYYDWVSRGARSPTNIYPAEVDIDVSGNTPDIFGMTPGTITNLERVYFEAHSADCPGCWPVNGQPAAHHLVDYVKIWDIPKNVIVPSYPH